MAGKTHSYPIRMRWTGNTGQGTRDYRGYERAHEYSVEGKPVIPGSSDPNFRVKDLDAMVKQLSDAGIKVVVDPEKYPNGRFARLYDPENNAIELWQPNGPYSGA